jgi:hypothetical protein
VSLDSKRVDHLVSKLESNLSLYTLSGLRKEGIINFVSVRTNVFLQLCIDGKIVKQISVGMLKNKKKTRRLAPFIKSMISVFIRKIVPLLLKKRITVLRFCMYHAKRMLVKYFFKQFKAYFRKMLRAYLKPSNFKFIHRRSLTRVRTKNTFLPSILNSYKKGKFTRSFPRHKHRHSRKNKNISITKHARQPIQFTQRRRYGTMSSLIPDKYQRMSNAMMEYHGGTSEVATTIVTPIRNSNLYVFGRKIRRVFVRRKKLAQIKAMASKFLFYRKHMAMYRRIRMTNFPLLGHSTLPFFVQESKFESDLSVPNNVLRALMLKGWLLTTKGVTFSSSSVSHRSILSNCLKFGEFSEDHVPLLVDGQVKNTNTVESEEVSEEGTMKVIDNEEENEDIYLDSVEEGIDSSDEERVKDLVLYKPFIRKNVRRSYRKTPYYLYRKKIFKSRRYKKIGFGAVRRDAYFSIGSMSDYTFRPLKSKLRKWKVPSSLGFVMRSNHLGKVFSRKRFMQRGGFKGFIAFKKYKKMMYERRHAYKLYLFNWRRILKLNALVNYKNKMYIKKKIENQRKWRERSLRNKARFQRVDTRRPWYVKPDYRQPWKKKEKEKEKVKVKVKALSRQQLKRKRKIAIYKRLRKDVGLSSILKWNKYRYLRIYKYLRRSKQLNPMIVNRLVRPFCVNSTIHLLNSLFFRITRKRRNFKKKWHGQKKRSIFSFFKKRTWKSKQLSNVTKKSKLTGKRLKMPFKNRTLSARIKKNTNRNKIQSK